MEKTKKKFLVKPTRRGFGRAEFTDANGKSCSIQISSAIHDEALLWLGFNEIGLTTFVPNTGGWVEHTDAQAKEIVRKGYNPKVETIMTNDRMHLTQSQVKQLLPLLKKFAETGELS